ncbi:MAG: nitronate monooxygenase [Nitriliruptoraceae bacterium]
MIIQGGMGVGVSSWRLANAIASAGQLGVVSGTANAVTHARQLAIGDPGGHHTRALDHFPFPDIAKRVYDRHFDTARFEDGQARFRGLPSPTLKPGRSLTELTVVANFVEVFLAKAKHLGTVGVNYLEKIQLPTLASIYGAMLAGVDYVLMGAGVPARIPAILDRLARNERVTMPVTVTGAERGDQYEIVFDPEEFAAGADLPTVKRPKFLAIVSSATMATYLSRVASGGPDGFVVEMRTAGGHNAPPRGRMTIDEAGEPVYGPRDEIELEPIAELGLPFWLAGGFGNHAGLQRALAAGASGIQVGTAFAFCQESGLDPEIRATTIRSILGGEAKVRTDALASPTGYPFKVLELSTTLSEQKPYADRPRLCDLGYLREPYKRDDGRVGYRCAAEPVDDYLNKGGELSEVEGRRCLCNALVANIGLGQQRGDGYAEVPMLTAGDDIGIIRNFMRDGNESYSAQDVLDVLLGNSPSALD